MKGKSRRKAADPKKAGQSNPDAAAIRDCVSYSQSVAAYTGGFDAEPDGNGRNASALGDRFITRSKELLGQLAASPVSTAEGILAKAKTALVLCRFNEACAFDGADRAFLKSVFKDTERFVGEIVKDHFVAACQANREAAERKST